MFEENDRPVLVTLAADGTDKQPPAGVYLHDGSCSSAPYEEHGPDIAYGDTAFGLVWSCDYMRILFGLASTTGTVLGSTNINEGVPSDAGGTAIAWNTDHFGVVWRAVIAPSTYEIYFDLVDPTLPLPSAHQADIMLSSSSPDTSGEPDIASGVADVGGPAAGFGVTWPQTQSVSPWGTMIYGAVFTLGSAASAPIQLAPSNRGEPRIAWNGTDFGVVFVNVAAPNDIEFIRMSQSGAPTGSFIQLDPTGDNDLYPVIVWQTDRFAGVWRRGVEGFFDYLWCTY